jgi:hypothetical protein
VDIRVMGGTQADDLPKFRVYLNKRASIAFGKLEQFGISPYVVEMQS